MTRLVMKDLVAHPGAAPLTAEIRSGSAVAVTRRSGAGRSTLLRCIAGTARPESGTVTLDGAAVGRSDVGVLDQGHHLIGALTALENIAVPALAQAGSAPDWTTLSALLTDLGLPDSAQRNLTEQLSGGQQQRIALGRALSLHPRLLCLDEPTSELDPASAEMAWSAIERAMEAGTIVLVATNDPQERARCTMELVPR